MNNSDFRIGNIIKYNIYPNTFMEITLIDQNEIYLDFEENVSDVLYCKLSDIIPVVLTEELLYSIGFKCEVFESNTVKDKVYYLEDENINLSITENNDGWSMEYSNNYYSISYNGLRFFHELQNSLSLAGFNLTIKNNKIYYNNLK